MKTKKLQDIKSVYGDTGELCDALEVAADMATDGSSRYYIKESQVHMEGLYAAAIDLEKEVKRLRKELAKASKVKAEPKTNKTKKK